MARGTDEVLVESAVTHHKRLRQAFLLGRVDRRRDIDDGVRSALVSLVLGAVACAGCVGFSFVAHAIATNNATSPTAGAGATQSQSPDESPDESPTGGG